MEKISRNQVESVMLTRPEKEAVITLIVVVSALFLLWVAFVFVFPDIGVVPYTDDVADNTKVTYAGVVESQKVTSTGGHLLLVVSNVTVFVQGGGSELFVLPGDRIRVLGTASTYGGKREIVVSSIADIDFLT